MSLVSKFGISDRTGTTNDPKLTVVHTAPVSLSQGTIQNINYTYDAVGNITNIADYSTSTGKIIDYTYDDLYRLTNATTSAASSTSYAHSYTYNSIGNLTTKSDVGSYTYAGTNYANPHAATTINGVTYGYDNNGNLTSVGSNTYTWNYRDRLTTVATGTATVTYGYDHDNQRVWQRTSTSATTTYPNQFYSLTAGASSTAYIYAGSDLVAFVDTGTTTSVTSYVHPDHLGSTHVVTNASGTVSQAMDYYPYGNTRIDAGTDISQKEYIGQYFDEVTDMSYLNARYYPNSRGQFISEDPVFWEVGQTSDGKNALMHPQSMNSYGYAGDNPITNKDPTGRFWWEGFYDWRGYNGWEGVVMKAGEVFGGHERAMNAIKDNEAAVNAASKQHGVHSALTNAIIYEEQSHLKPDEILGREQFFPNIGTGGVGVMQVSGSVGKNFGGYTKSELARDPVKNINAGTAYLSSIQNSFSAPNQSSKIIGVGTQYNGSAAYGERINAQVSNPNYNRNIIVSRLKNIVSALQKIVASLSKKSNK